MRMKQYLTSYTFSILWGILFHNHIINETDVPLRQSTGSNYYHQKLVLIQLCQIILFQIFLFRSIFVWMIYEVGVDKVTKKRDVGRINLKKGGKR